VPGWLLGLTAVALAVFLAGVGLRLFAWPKPEGPAAAGRPPDAGAPPEATPAPVVPEGLGQVAAGGAHGAFFVARAPVTNRRLADWDHRHASRFKPDRLDAPATLMTYAEARNFAASTGMRLLREGEWHALTDLGLVADAAVWEWVEGADAAAAKQPTRRADRRTLRAADKGYANVTFRLAQDVP
jgi:hypothetical protein